MYRQHNAKKPKLAKQQFDTTFDNINPMTNSIPSPAASQMSNMSNLSKSIKIISSRRDQGRKAKTLKISAGQPGFGGPWSLFEDQALVVLVHDMGPNWELISDAINSALQFKCVFRKPKECKERHKILMDRSAGDGADSAEDSGSSQSYPSTLPGIPKAGSARQLFQRLQGPMEEDTIKSHFEKIIKIGQKQHHRKNQNDNQDLKKISPVHNSHVIALSQVCPNNLNGGFLTPLDLCDINAPAPDALGYQGSHAGGLVLPNQGSVPSVLPTSGVNPSLPGSSGMVLGNNLPSPSGPATASVRDSRYGVPRTSPLSVDEQQRIQQYNPMLSGRNVQQSGISVGGSLSGSDRSIRMLPGGNGVGMIGGVNRSMAISRSGFQGLASSSMMSSGSMLSSSNMVGTPSPVNMPSGVGSGQGNSMLRPREALHMMRPGYNSEHQRQTVVPELQMQVTLGNSQSIPAFSGLSSAFNNQTTPPPVQPYPGQAQQPHQLSQQQAHLSSPHTKLQGPNHTSNKQQQAFAARLAKERQLQQQRYLQHQQQFAASNALMPHVQTQSQLPMSSSLQSSSQVQSQNSSQPVSLPPVTPSSPLTPTSSQHQQQKHQLPQHGFSRNPGASGLNNQAVKQRQRPPQQQQYQQPNRQHPNQRHHAQSQQQAKLLKGIGRGNILVQHNISVDPSNLNGLSVPTGSQTAEKGDQITHMMQGQNLYPVSGLKPTQPSKPLGPAHSSNHSQLQQNLHSGPTTTSSKQNQPVVSPSDNSAQRQVPLVPTGHILTPPHTTVPPAVLASNNAQQQQQSSPQSKKINHTQSSVHRMLQRSQSSSKPQSDSTQVDQPTMNNASQISASTAVNQGCIDLSSVVPVIPTLSSQRRTTESPLDSNVPNPANQGSSLGNTPVGNSAGKEPISQGVSPRQLSLNMPSHVHNAGAQWKQPQPIKQSSSQTIMSQQPYQPQEQHQQGLEQHSPKHLALQHEPQQQLQHLQPGQNSMFVCPSNSKGE
ncbi:chromatin modification-related protein EAF1 B-like isoform X1 [Senna tora]|uniref:Chromatin modification-related protein EAF1 B-like isoform X1 n=1 Tax=Senna tora TaxID=362788 RepID=A0A834XLS9_9FABA|nr:chromatin modification-related protein EAF1 B-like isoform X1 [Senna tora]